MGDERRDVDQFYEGGSVSRASPATEAQQLAAALDAEKVDKSALAGVPSFSAAGATLNRCAAQIKALTEAVAAASACLLLLLPARGQTQLFGDIDPAFPVYTNNLCEGFGPLIAAATNGFIRAESDPVALAAVVAATNAMNASRFVPAGSYVDYYDMPMSYFLQVSPSKYVDIYQYRSGTYDVLRYNGTFTFRARKDDLFCSLSILRDNFFSGTWTQPSVVSFTTSPVRVHPSGTLTASSDGWPEGHACFVVIDPSEDYTVAGNVHLIGYSVWPTNSTQSVWWRVGTNFYVNLVAKEL